MLKIALLILLGLLWSVRLSAIKAAGLSGIPVHVVVAVAALGIAILFSLCAVWRHDWPPLNRKTVAFYALSGTLGFLAPFILESTVAPKLPVFLFVVIIATMPLLTYLLSILTGSEKNRFLPMLAVCLGFFGAVTIVWDGSLADISGQSNLFWIAAAFGVPLLYALNTVFVATRWPEGTGPLHVAHAQALLVATFGVIGSVASGAITDWQLVSHHPQAVVLIVLGEGLALLVYLQIARDYGATFVSFANYVSMIFAAMLGAVWFGDQLTPITVSAAILIAAAVAIFQRSEQIAKT